MSYVPKTYRKAGGDEFVVASGGTLTCESGSTVSLAGTVVDSANPMVRVVRRRNTIAEVNAGVTLLAAPGAAYKYRMVSCKAIAYGGAVGGTTTVDVLGTQTTSKKLVAFAQASLTQSTVLTAGGTGSTVLADGASFIACDANTAITVGKTGNDLTTATGVDIIFEYVIEAA